MKKIIFASLFILSIKISGQEVSFGLKAGLAIVSQRISEEIPIEITPRFSYEFGAVLNYNISSHLKLSVEPGFVEKGSINSFIPSHKFSLKFGYLTMPILFKISPLKRIHIDIGNEFGYLTYSKRRDLGDKVQRNDSKDSNKFESSVVLGITIVCNRKFDFFYKVTIAYTPLVTTIYYLDPGLSGSFNIYNNYHSFGVRYFILNNKK